ncbi:7657_t:CDS:2 [Ambispora leptoticha]|uniref:7657_t:CDS:1 n=1 Tax=Ambispora leptoticha TaxID=144679 RepID=A0A9N8YQM8_9GLOM|nr:7657_t:CDS:2 [Ambispora leptoticha]
MVKTNAQIRILIDEHRNRNEEYHNFERNRIRFWDSITIKINQEHNTSFNGYQCKKKFMNLVQNYNGIKEHEEVEQIIGGNNISVPSIGEVEHELGQILPASPSLFRDIINTNTNNPGVENPEQNIDHAGSIKTSSLQLAPPPYEATDEV